MQTKIKNNSLEVRPTCVIKSSGECHIHERRFMQILAIIQNLTKIIQLALCGVFVALILKVVKPMGFSFKFVDICRMTAQK